MTHLQKYGTTRWSDGLDHRVVKPPPRVKPICDRCFQPGVHQTRTGCINALSSPAQRPRNRPR